MKKTAGLIVACVILFCGVRMLRRHQPALQLPPAEREALRDAVAGDDQAPAPAPTPAPPAAPAAQVCNGKAQTFDLDANRNRLLAQLAGEKGKDVCAFWGSLSLAERDIFDMVTAYLGSCESRLAKPPSNDTDTLLNHVAKLYSINGPGLDSIIQVDVPSAGGACGGYDSNRIFVGFDDVGMQALRDSYKKKGGTSNPDKKSGYNDWGPADDLGGANGGAHTPFTARDMLSWGGFLSLFGNSDGPDCSFFAKDSDLNASSQALLWQRRGVCGVTDPHIVEMTIAFNITHESDPLCNKGWLDEVRKKVGPAEFMKYNPNGSCKDPSASTNPDGDGPNPAGLGTDQKVNPACATGGTPPATPTEPKLDPASSQLLIDKIQNTQVQ